MLAWLLVIFEAYLFEKNVLELPNVNGCQGEITFKARRLRRSRRKLFKILAVMLEHPSQSGPPEEVIVPRLPVIRLN